jgi:hypothetical protein
MPARKNVLPRILNMGKTKKTESVNVAIYLYSGQLEMNFECVGADKCAYARFHVEGSDTTDDNCAFIHQFQCTYAPAQKKALEQILEMIATQLAE